jgi:hypothetical protein
MGAGRRARWAGFVVAAAATAALLTGCGAGEIPKPPMETEEVAEVTSAGPDCLAGEILLELFGVELAGSAPTAPVAGKVPGGFEPVQIVLCRPGPLTLVEPEPFEIVTALPSPLPTAASSEDGHDRTPATVTVEQVTLTGDLAPLRTALESQSDPYDGRPCPAMWESKPQIYLVDADGDAVRPRWPTNACGILHKGAAERLAHLEEVSSVDQTAEIDLGEGRQSAARPRPGSPGQGETADCSRWSAIDPTRVFRSNRGTSTSSSTCDRERPEWTSR